MELTFLGTSAMVPTKERNVSGLFTRYKTEGILFDCGEGSQRQMNICGIKRTAATKVLISHWHGDHVAGLIGLIQTIGNKEINPKLEIYGPLGTKEHIEYLKKAVVFDIQVRLDVHELVPKNNPDTKNGVLRFFENEDFALECAELKHNIPCLAYSFIELDRRKINTAYLRKIKVPDGPHLKKLVEGESIKYKGIDVDVEKATYIVKGKKITIILDTVFCDNCINIAKDADFLICESTYLSSLQEKADQYKHLTAKDAAMIANQANVKKLILTHFSQRYKNVLELQEEAQTYFDNVICAEDLMKVRL